MTKQNSSSICHKATEKRKFPWFAQVYRVLFYWNYLFQGRESLLTKVSCKILSKNLRRRLKDVPPQAAHQYLAFILSGSLFSSLVEEWYMAMLWTQSETPRPLQRGESPAELVSLLQIQYSKNRRDPDVVPTCNPSTPWNNAGSLWIQGHPELHNKASLE